MTGTRTTNLPRLPAFVRAVGPMLVGFVVLLSLFPVSVLHSDPPQCFATLAYRVPCGQINLPGFTYAGWALAGSIAALATTRFAMLRLSRP